MNLTASGKVRNVELERHVRELFHDGSLSTTDRLRLDGDGARL